MKKISVIVPVYNMEKYLVRCLESIVNQTYPDLEIICVNDGSTDSSAKILETYASKDKRIKLITKENGGLSSARNAGINAATGEFITFVDSDDWIQPPYRIHSHSAILYKFRNAFTIHLIAHGCDKTARLVQHDITERLLFRNLSPIDGNRVSFRIDFIPNLSSGTIDLYTPLRNQHFALTT